MRYFNGWIKVKIPVVSKKVKVSLPLKIRISTEPKLQASYRKCTLTIQLYNTLAYRIKLVLYHVQQLYSWGWRCIVGLRWWPSFVDLSLSGLPLLINHQSDPNITISRYRPCILQLSNHKGFWYDYQDSFQHDQVDHRVGPRAKSRQYLTLYL